VKRPLLVIDGDSFAHCAYHALPKTIRRRPDKGAGAMVGFATSSSDCTGAKSRAPFWSAGIRWMLRPTAIEHEDEGALAVDRDAARRSGPEAVAEDLVREEPVVAGRLERLHEGVDGEFALAGERAVVAAPGEVVHFEERRIRDLDEDDAFLRIARMGARSVLRTRMWKESRMSPIAGWSAPHHLPGVAIVVDVAAPGEGLVADAQPAPCRALAELAEVGRGAVDSAERILGDVAAHEEEIAAELLHHVELALRAGERLCALRLGHALKVAEGLERDDLEAKVGGHAAHGRRRAVNDRRSFSKISTLLNCAAAMASSFSERVPLRETVAIAVCIWFQPAKRCSGMP
jgi:hypothetical protein